MNDKIFFELHRGLSREGYGRDIYTKRAFDMISLIENPTILDIGCGSGVPTILLAKLSSGNVIGMDIHQSYLDELERKAKESNLSHRVKTLNCSMLEMDFPDEYFNIIWSEGSIFVVGFEQGLKEWKRLIKPKGFLAVHEMVWLEPDPPREIREYLEKMYSGITTIPDNLDIIKKCDYKILGYFPLPEDAWWEAYYQPLEKRVQILKEKYKNNQSALNVLNKEQEEINLYCKYSKWYGSAFFVMQKK